MALSFDAETERTLSTYGFDLAGFEQLRRVLREGGGVAQNRERRAVEPPATSDLTHLPPLGGAERTSLAELGRAAIARGEVGAVVLAGGMATRFGGVVKAGARCLDEHTFLDLKLRDVAAVGARAGGTIPVFLMASFATEQDVRRLGAARATARMPVETFAQFVSVRLTPDGELFRDEHGRPSLYAPGHGDLTFALRRSGILARFRRGGGRTLFVSNVDNVTATLDPAIIGLHLRARAELTAEMAPKEPGDKGGAPALVDGHLQIVEGFRFPEDFDQDTIPVFNTNTLVLDAAAIDRDFPLTWFTVEKRVDGRKAIQFEHLVGELTAFLRSQFVVVDRHGDDARFQPAKDPEELERRQAEIRAALSARGVI
jgi:UTP--glucose-1-phosphate uridylyltransferase